MRPPSYAKSVSVKNTAPHAVKVTVTFGSDDLEANGNAKIVESREVASQEEITFDEHEYNMDTYTMVAPLHSLHAEPTGGANASGAAAFKPEVSGIVDLLKVEIKPHESNGALHITAL